jgi:hypothetical protein
MHVCACCELGQFETEMHSSLFTVKTLERAVRGLPAPGMECSRHRWETLTDEQCAVAATIGWTEGAWDGVDEPGDAVCQWLTGTRPKIKSVERDLARQFGLLDGWSERSRRLKKPGASAKVLKRLRTRTDGIPSTTFLGYQIQADAVIAEDRLDLDNYLDEETMARQCRFGLCTTCHSSLCLGDSASMPKNAVANGNNTAVNLWRSNAQALPGQTRREECVVSEQHPAFFRTTRAIYYDGKAFRDLQAALSTLDELELQQWAEQAGVDTPAFRSARTLAASVQAILAALQAAPDKPPGVVAIGYVQHLLEDLALLEERLVAGVWTNAGFQVKYVINQDRHQYRQTCLKGHIVCAPQSVGPTAADGHPFAFPDLCESFQIVYVGDTSTLSDLQRDLRQRAKMHIPLDRELPFVRREPVRKYLQFVWHHRLRGDCRRSFGTSHTSPAWAAYFDTLLPPGAEIGIPQPLVDAATWLSSKDAAEQELRAAGHKPSESGENVTRVQRTEADDEGEQNDASAGQEPGQQDEDMQRARGCCCQRRWCGSQRSSYTHPPLNGEV